jgi:hypothetical protein
MIRQSVFIFFNLILRLPVWGLLALLRPLRPFRYIFLVYPGSEKDLAGYCPKWLLQTPLFKGRPTIGGIITSNREHKVRGLVLVIPNTIAEMQANPELCRKIKSRLLRIQKLSGAVAVAMAGQMPGLFSRHGINLEDPFVGGLQGTVFSVVETVQKLVEIHHLDKSNRFAVVGIGHMGGAVVDCLKEMGFEVAAIDIRRSRQGVLLPEESHKTLAEADLVVVLTPKGKDFAPYLNWLKPGCLVVDDTHPRLLNDNHKLKLFKVAVGLPETRFYPRLPGYQAIWLPGCVIEAIYVAAQGGFMAEPIPVFIEKARRLGYYPHLDR